MPVMVSIYIPVNEYSGVRTTIFNLWRPQSRDHLETEQNPQFLSGLSVFWGFFLLNVHTHPPPPAGLPFLEVIVTELQPVLRKVC